MYRLGIIGLGIMGRHVLADCHNDSRFRVTAVWDLNADHILRIQQEYPHIQVADSAHSLIAQDDVDVVYIATPPSAHIEYAHLAMDYHKAVLCEKPLSVDIDAAQHLVNRAKSLNIQNGLNFMYGEMVSVRALDEAVRSGEPGEITAIEAYMHFPAWPRAWQNTGTWLAGRKEGGFVREVYSHYVYLLEKLFGHSRVIWRHTHEISPNQAETGMMALLEVGKIPIRYMGAIGGAAPEQIVWTMYGTLKSYRLWNWTTLQVSDGGSWQDVTLVPARPLDELARMLGGEPHLLADFALGLRVQHIIETITGTQ